MSRSESVPDAGVQSLSRAGKRSIVPAIAFTRTQAERDDEMLSWKRTDEAFFAAGACHILAYRLVARHPEDGFRIVYLKPRDNVRGSHVFITDGHRVFDFNGWTDKDEFLTASVAACKERYGQDWSYELVELEGDLEASCAMYNHRLPEDFAFDPTARADRATSTRSR